LNQNRNVEENGITCDDLNEHFVNEPINIVNNVLCDHNPDPDLFIPYEGVFIDEEFVLPSVSESFIEKQISDMSNCKATGWDAIGPNILKTFSTLLIPIIIVLVNLSVSKVTGIFPSVWKIEVSALHKTGSKKEPNNYRPISVLPIVSKL